MSGDELTVANLSVHYPLPGGGLLGRHRRELVAVNDVSFTLRAGQTLGIVGETGCGKSSLGKAILQLVRPAAGQVIWRGQNLCELTSKQLKPLRKDLQIIFQDPLSSLNPRMTIGEIVAEPLLIHSPELTARQREKAALDMLERVGLGAGMAKRYPNEFSGGQCQRASIARAMILKPRIIVCDEPVSALDVSIQAQICNLLKELQRDTGIAMIFISHDLSIVRYMSHRIMVMYLGRVMELAGRDSFFARPLHPYSRALVRSIPVPDPDQPLHTYLQTLEDEPPSPLTPPSGCAFRTRCSQATPVCVARRPELDEASSGHAVACHFWQEIEPSTTSQETTDD
ncbi:MAG TPA: ATP-binding cassette domain-containing protein [Chromatiales bacterium]|nr:ATP-binding cassette domain-containing protein [Chromatiales bacterium]